MKFSLPLLIFVVSACQSIKPKNSNAQQPNNVLTESALFLLTSKTTPVMSDEWIFPEPTLAYTLISAKNNTYLGLNITSPTDADFVKVELCSNDDLRCDTPLYQALFPQTKIQAIIEIAEEGAQTYRLNLTPGHFNNTSANPPLLWAKPIETLPVKMTLAYSDQQERVYMREMNRQEAILNQAVLNLRWHYQVLARTANACKVRGQSVSLSPATVLQIQEVLDASGDDIQTSIYQAIQNTNMAKEKTVAATKDKQSNGLIGAVIGSTAGLLLGTGSGAAMFHFLSGRTQYDANIFEGYMLHTITAEGKRFYVPTKNLQTKTPITNKDLVAEQTLVTRANSGELIARKHFIWLGEYDAARSGAISARYKRIGRGAGFLLGLGIGTLAGSLQLYAADECADLPARAQLIYKDTKNLANQIEEFRRSWQKTFN